MMFYEFCQSLLIVSLGSKKINIMNTFCNNYNSSVASTCSKLSGSLSIEDLPLEHQIVGSWHYLISRLLMCPELHAIDLQNMIELYAKYYNVLKEQPYFVDSRGKVTDLLQFLVREKRFEELNWLIQIQPTLAKALGANTQTLINCLMYAPQNAVKFLVEHNRNPYVDSVFPHSVSTKTHVLLLLAARGEPAIFNEALTYFPDTKIEELSDSRGLRLLHYALINDTEMAANIVRMSTEKELKLLFRPDRVHRRTPLHLAAMYGRTKMIQMIVERDSKSPDSQDSFGFFAWELAIFGCHLLCAELLNPNLKSLRSASMYKYYAGNIELTREEKQLKQTLREEDDIIVRELSSLFADQIQPALAAFFTLVGTTLRARMCSNDSQKTLGGQLLSNIKHICEKINVDPAKQELYNKRMAVFKKFKSKSALFNLTKFYVPRLAIMQK